MGFRGLGVFSVQGVGFRDGCGLGYRDVWDLRFGVWSSGFGGLGNRVSGALEDKENTHVLYIYVYIYIFLHIQN